MIGIVVFGLSGSCRFLVTGVTGIVGRNDVDGKVSRSAGTLITLGLWLQEVSEL